MKKSKINTWAVVRHQARDTVLSEVQTKNEQEGPQKKGRKQTIELRTYYTRSIIHNLQAHSAGKSKSRNPKGERTYTKDAKPAASSET